MSLLLLVLLAGCGRDVDVVKVSGEGANQGGNVSSVFADSVTLFQVSVFYEPGAVPYTGNVLGFPVWDITLESYQQLFQNHPARTVDVPGTTAQMQAIAAQNKPSWTAAELHDLAAATAPALVDGTTVHLSVFFLNGSYQGDASILGVHVDGYPYAFVFKDSVAGVGGGAIAQRYVEQATVVHEIGHAVGLVNNGLPMVTNHEDAAHPHHSTDTHCVMYWQVGSRSDVVSFLQQAIGSGRKNLFGSYSLNDGRSYHP